MRFRTIDATTIDIVDAQDIPVASIVLGAPDSQLQIRSRHLVETQSTIDKMGLSITTFAPASRQIERRRRWWHR